MPACSRRSGISDVGPLDNGSQASKNEADGVRRQGRRLLEAVSDDCLTGPAYVVSITRWFERFTCSCSSSIITVAPHNAARDCTYSTKNDTYGKSNQQAENPCWTTGAGTTTHTAGSSENQGSLPLTPEVILRVVVIFPQGRLVQLQRSIVELLPAKERPRRELKRGQIGAQTGGLYGILGRLSTPPAPLRCDGAQVKRARVSRCGV